MKLTLVHPCVGRRRGEKYIRSWQMEPLPPAVLAGLTPKEIEIKFYDDNDCLNFLNQEYSQKHVDVFNFLADGPIKADFWRACILYKYGGVYADIDIEPLLPIKDIIENF